jgi:hypothetical protein
MKYRFAARLTNFVQGERWSKLYRQGRLRAHFHEFTGNGLWMCPDCEAEMTRRSIPSGGVRQVPLARMAEVIFYQRPSLRLSV